MILKQKIRYGYDKSLESAMWETILNESIEINNLLLFFDNLSSRSNKLDFWGKFACEFPEYAQSLPFLVRQALLNHGFPVNDIIEYPASW